MITKNGTLRCEQCGKFMSWSKPYYVYTPYGSYRDQEPPDDCHIHKKCYENLSDSSKKYLNVSWQKPLLIGEIK